ncbi:tRNA pseudouridine(55) synthase TruB [Afifella sp. JA880]|uniref:tRNA pseudouridine(55) synthase TruB n=1 Tax=Afifella sp. JA880 TaxID=2975280 RepID=UPI0021BAA1D0|nr:tRNA pseudouridine(55) synthase TruB [Afifella sp. JA880]MCT8268761.1 tRNA pseudouridine(55) synthase TruB [Afifella sp. JA880]
MSRRRNKGRDVDGWLVLDKPVGMTSTEAVAKVKRAFDAKKAGHAGTLDPLASGCLPIALGEATKTVAFVMDGRKVYEFTVRWGEKTETDDREGPVVERSDVRPSEDDIRALIPDFTGTLSQVPPRYSAVKIAGERAYDLARDGETVELEPREIVVHRLDLVDRPDADHAIFHAECGKGTYVRALARDMAEELGTVAHVSALRRLVVGPFGEDDMVPYSELEANAETPGALLRPVEAGLTDLPSIRIDNQAAMRLRNGQAAFLRGADAPIGGSAYTVSEGRLVALVDIAGGEMNPRRVFKL